MVEVTAEHLAGGSGAGGFIPQRVNNFSLEIQGLEGLRLALSNASFPVFRSVKGEINFQNEVRYFIQAAEFDSVTVQIVDYIDQDLMGKLYDWYIQGYDPDTGEIGNAGAYKRDATLILHNPSGGQERKWKWQGCFIEELNGGEGDMSARGEPNRLSLTLSVDKIVRG